MANLDKEQFRSAYRYLCSYAHTGHLSIFQMQQATDFSDTVSLTEVWLDSVLGIISHFIFDYLKVYPKGEEILKQFPHVETLAHIYDGFGRRGDEPNSVG